LAAAAWVWAADSASWPRKSTTAIAGESVSELKVEITVLAAIVRANCL
jgi:hypothetical protein